LTSGSRKLSPVEKQEAKIIIRECIISRFSREEALAYFKQKMKREDLTIYDVDGIKRSLKNDTEKWMNSLMKDRWAYVAQYKERVDEYYKYQKEYWRIFHMNPTNGYLQKITLDSLQNVSAALTQLYDILPEIAGGTFVDVKNPISKTTEEKTTAENPTAWTT
jgi:hypothetical protein